MEPQATPLPRRTTRKREPRRDTPSHPAHGKGEGTARYLAHVTARANEGCPRHVNLLAMLRGEA